MSLSSTSCLVRILLVAGLTVGCERAPAQRTDGAKSPSAVADPAAVYSTGNVQGPIASTLSGPAAPRPGNAVWLTLRIDRRLLSSTLEVSVQVTLPDGVALQHGELLTRVLPDSAPVTELRYALRSNILPDEDATFTVSATGDGFGYQANLPYRFGRERALPKTPARAAAAVRVGDRSFGAAVSIVPAP